MRDKIKKLIGLITTPVDANIESYVEQFTAGFKQAHGEDLPEDAKKAIAVVTDAMHGRTAVLEDSVIAVYERHLADEATVDALLAFYETDAYKKLAAASPTIMSEVEECLGTWVTDTMKGVEAQLEALLGVPAAPPPDVLETPAATPPTAEG